MMKKHHLMWMTAVAALSFGSVASAAEKTFWRVVQKDSTDDLSLACEQDENQTWPEGCNSRTIQVTSRPKLGETFTTPSSNCGSSNSITIQAHTSILPQFGSETSSNTALLTRIRGKSDGSSSIQVGERIRSIKVDEAECCLDNANEYISCTDELATKRVRRVVADVP